MRICFGRSRRSAGGWGALIGHLAVEDRYLYPAVLATGDAGAKAVALRLEQEMGQLSAEFTAHMTRWTDERIAGDWARFCEETNRMLAILAERIRRENETLYPLALANWIGCASAAREAGTDRPAVRAAG